MPSPELVHLELLAEVDALAQRLQRWADRAPDWPAAHACRALVQRLVERTRLLRVRLESPLVVATMGGTGTGKSSLVNALVGMQVVQAGPLRPTTTRPVLICRPDITPQMLGIDPRDVDLIHHDAPALGHMVLVDCPDPDTTEVLESGSPAADRQEPAGPQSLSPTARETTLGRLRRILPHCDVLLVTTTQQKYRSARVSAELSAAATGARLIFIQTHGGRDEDIRADWRHVLAEQYATGHIFLVDSHSALAEAQRGIAPSGEFGRLIGLLQERLAGAAAARIRRANFFDLVAETLGSCRKRIDADLPGVGELQTALQQQRARLGARLAQQMRTELMASRGPWESRLLGQVAARWGLSPFALVLRTYQGLGGLLAGAVLWRARTPAQMALWGAAQGVRAWHRHRRDQTADRGASRAVASGWDPAELRAAAVVLQGYARDAGLGPDAAAVEKITAEADRAGASFIADVAAELHLVVARLADRRSGLLTRLRYEALLLAMLGLLLYRLGRNFFFDSWFAPLPVPVYGLDFYLAAAFWLVLWCLLLLWAFTSRLRRGMRAQIGQLAEQWSAAGSAVGLFQGLEDQCRRVETFRAELDSLQTDVDQVRRHVATPEAAMGKTTAALTSYPSASAPGRTA